MIIDYIVKNPEVQAILITSIIIPILIVSIKSIKQNVLLSVQVQLNRALDDYDAILDRVRFKVDSLEDREKNFQERVGYFMENLDTKQDEIVEKLDNIQDLENQLGQKMHLLQLQYNDIRSRLEFNEPNLRGKLDRDTAPDKDF